MNTLFQTFQHRLISRYGNGEARALTFLVFEEVFGISRTDIYVGKGRHFSVDETQRLWNICERLEGGEPIQYIVGETLFCDLRFRVTPAVLIPRPETEELVDWTVQTWEELRPSTSSAPHIWDACTGSGCIAISLGHRLPTAQITACDVSEEALTVARSNAERLQVAVTFEQQDLLQPAPAPAQPYDLLVSNPPYICLREQAEMEAHVLDQEPHLALFVPDEDPLRFYRALAHHATHGALTRKGAMLVEINRAYARETADLFHEYGFQQVEIRRDAYGNERMIRASKRS